MTKLDCTVSSCLYNKERCCCKDNIEVSGQNARHSRETCCRSFRERDAGPGPERGGHPHEKYGGGLRSL